MGIDFGKSEIDIFLENKYDNFKLNIPILIYKNVISGIKNDDMLLLQIFKRKLSIFSDEIIEFYDYFVIIRSLHWDNLYEATENNKPNAKYNCFDPKDYKCNPHLEIMHCRNITDIETIIKQFEKELKYYKELPNITINNEQISYGNEWHIFKVGKIDSNDHPKFDEDTLKYIIYDLKEIIKKELKNI